MGKLTVRQVEALKVPGRYSDGNNLYLSVAKGGSKSWVLFYRLGNTRKEMGLGSVSTVTLAEARVKAFDALKLLHEGRDPLAVRRLERKKLDSTNLSLGDFADEYLASPRVTNIKNKADRRQWERVVHEHLAPIRAKPLADIDTDDIVKVLKPVWRATPESGRKLRLRLEEIFNSAKAKGKFPGENPARWRGHLQAMKDDFPLRKKDTVRHHAALKYDDLPAFISDLRKLESNGIAASALEFCILTATRSGETLGATWKEFDRAKGVWIIPKYRMKAGHEHRIPLPSRALEILDTMAKEGSASGDHVFRGRNRNNGLSNMAMVAVLRRMRRGNITVHGFRSTFRDWASECTSFSHETSEHALAHRISDKAEAAYRRGDQFEKRRKLMEAWKAFAEGKSNRKLLYPSP